MTGVESGKLLLACDNITAGKIALQRSFPITPKWNNYDIISAIHRQLKTIPFEVEYKHVQGHQKENQPQAELDGWAILNDAMDRLAKTYMQQTVQLETLDQSIDDQEWEVRIEGSKIVSDLKRYLAQAIRRHSIVYEWTQPITKHGYTVRKPRFSLVQINLMDESNIYDAWRQAKGHLRRFVCKASVDQLATGKYMRRMDFWPSDKCPRCLCDNETSIHILQCPCPNSRDILRESFTALFKAMMNLDTNPDILIAIHYLLHTGTTLSIVDVPTKPSVVKLLTAQLQLPIEEFLRGRIVKDWAITQHKHLRMVQSPRSANKWAAVLVTKLWETYFNSWHHRNNTFHQSESKKDSIYNIPELNYEIRRQWRLGTQELHDADKKHFLIPQAQLLRKN